MPEVLTPAQSDAYLSCRNVFYDEAVADDRGNKDHVNAYYPVDVPHTYAGDCNIFGSVFFIYLFVGFFFFFFFFFSLRWKKLKFLSFFLSVFALRNIK